MSTSAIILAAGSGRRMQQGVNKILLPLHDRPLLGHTLDAFDDHPDIDEMILVIRSDEVENVERLVQPLATRPRLVEGGRTRRDSALAGVRAAKGDVVLIHDGARPFPTAALISCVIASARSDAAAVPVLPVNDLLHQLNAAGAIQFESAFSHHALVRVQTPQGFHRDLILRCLEKAPAEIRDDATALLLAGEHVATVPGDPCNIKVTHPSDLQLAEAIAALRS